MLTASLSHARLLLLASACTMAHSFMLCNPGMPSRGPSLVGGCKLAPPVPLRGGSPLQDSKKEAYYETIDGIKYDRGVLDAARAAVEGAGDGRVSKADAESILEKLFDGQSVSQVEYRTAFLILRDYSFTEQAQKLFIEKLATAE
mmetsp:Transcript_14732/g.30512  ORF Transcript_14732/g.30512 Transcript_14732/m.30512 type:complete len:145 (+) Transcript_14732:29-463(+)